MTSRSSRSRTKRLYDCVLTRISRQLNAAMSTPVASKPDSSACTSVVPEPANGSSTCPPRATYRSSSVSASCGMNFPRYGWRRWTCFVRSRSGRSRSDQERSRSISEYSASCVEAIAYEVRERYRGSYGSDAATALKLSPTNEGKQRAAARQATALVAIVLVVEPDLRIRRRLGDEQRPLVAAEIR